MASKMLPKGKGKKKNQQLLLLGGGAAVVVVIAALMKRSSAASSAAGGTSGTAASTTGVQGTYDSTANDVYNSLEDQLGALQQQIASITQGSQGSGGTSTGGTGGTSSGGAKKPPTGVHGKPIPGPKKPVPVSLQTVTVGRNQTLSGIAKSHGETLGQLLKDNPVYTTNKKYKGGNLIFAGDKVKVR